MNLYSFSATVAEQGWSHTGPKDATLQDVLDAVTAADSSYITGQYPVEMPAEPKVYLTHINDWNGETAIWGYVAAPDICAVYDLLDAELSAYRPAS